MLNGFPLSPLIVAKSARERGRGLLGTNGIAGAMWIEPCPSVHMVGMRYPIDVAQVADDGTVLAVKTLRPWTGLTWPSRKVRAHVEAAVGFFARSGVNAGDRLEIG
jgi:uncharacterized membrane protein (UPF0127 family)